MWSNVRAQLITPRRLPEGLESSFRGELAQITVIYSWRGAMKNGFAEDTLCALECLQFLEYVFKECYEGCSVWGGFGVDLVTSGLSQLAKS